ncbi:MAG: hypothetical protein R3F39_11885 [Myxococcota bacterium]
MRPWLARALAGVAALACVGALTAGDAARAVVPPRAGVIVGLSGRAMAAPRSAPASKGRRPARGAPTPAPEAAPRVLDLLDLVEVDEALEVSDGSTVWVLERPNTLWRLMGPASYRFGARGPRPAGGASDQLAPVRFAIAELTDDASAPAFEWQREPRPDDRSLPPGAEDSGLIPRETAIVDPRPTLAWRPGQPGERHTAALWRLEADGGLVPLERWESLETPRLRPWQPLPRGAFIYWRLAGQDAMTTSRTPDSAWIYVMRADEVEAVQSDQRALDRARAEFPEASVALALVEAWTLERHGLLDSAAAAYQTIAARRDLESASLAARIEALTRRELIAPRERRAARERDRQPPDEHAAP